MATVAVENGRRQFDYWVTVYKRTWKGSLVSSFLLPLLYLAAMGIGLGSFVDANGTGALGGISYLQHPGGKLQRLYSAPSPGKTITPESETAYRTSLLAVSTMRPVIFS